MGGAYQLSTWSEWLRQFWNCFLSIFSRKSRVNGKRKRIIPHFFCEFIEKGFLFSPPSISQYCSQNSFNPHAGMHARIAESLSCLPSEFSFSSALTRHHKQTTSIPLQPHFSSIKFYFAFILCLRNFSDYTKIENISSAFTSILVLLPAFANLWAAAAWWNYYCNSIYYNLESILTLSKTYSRVD